MGVTRDQITVRYGTPGNSTQPVNQPLGANATVYRGTVATTRAGYLVAATSPQSTDFVWGLVNGAGPGTADMTTQGIVGGTTNGAVSVEIATGTFFLANGTGADAFTQADVGKTVYLGDEITGCKTNGSNTRPVAGVLEAYDTTEIYALGPLAVKLGNLGGSTGTGGPS